MSESQPRPKFDLELCAVVKTDQQLDDATCFQRPLGPACIVVVPPGKETSSTLPFHEKSTLPLCKESTKFSFHHTLAALVLHPVISVPFLLGAFAFERHRRSKKVVVTVKPCAAYLHYVEAINLQGTSEHTFQKSRGYTARFNASTETTGSVKLGIEGCEASLDVTTKFACGIDITERIQETWKETLKKGRYAVFQSVLLYAHRVDTGTEPEKSKSLIRSCHPTITFYDGKGSFSKYLYFFVPVYRNKAFTISHSDVHYDAVGYDSLVYHLMNDGFSRWES